MFNIVVIWMAIFIGLSKGLKSYGKVSLIFGVVPIVGLVVFCTKVKHGHLPYKYMYRMTRQIESYILFPRLVGRFCS